MPEPEPHLAPPPPPQPAPAPRAPGFFELFEQSLEAIVDPSVFRRAAERPAPSFGAAAGLALAAGAAALAVNLVHAFISSPGLLGRFSPAVQAAVGVAALGFYSCLMLLLAAALYGIGRGFGGKGEFDRGLQAAAMISVLAPVQMLCNWFPIAWIVPALLAAWVAAGALEGLFNARPGPARALCALLAAAAIGLQAAGRALTDRAIAVYGETQAVKTALIPEPNGLVSMAAGPPHAENAAAAAVSAPVATSGLDLLRGGPPEGEAGVESQQPAPSAPAQGVSSPAMAANMQAMQANAAGMLDALTPMLNMLQKSSKMGPQQKADVKELQGLMQELKTQMVSGKKMDDSAFKEKMSRYQSLLMKVMAYSAPAPSAAPAR